LYVGVHKMPTKHDGVCIYCNLMRDVAWEIQSSFIWYIHAGTVPHCQCTNYFVPKKEHAALCTVSSTVV
jgi:hypothetical protein